MFFNWKRKRFDNLIMLSNNKLSSMSKKRSNNILSLKASPDEVRSSINFDSTMSINLSDKRDFSSRNRQLKISMSINICIETEVLGQMPECLPEIISEYSWKSCAVFLTGKTSVRLLIMVIVQKSLAGSPEGMYCRACMPLQHSFLPETIEALNSSIPAWFSLRDKYQVYSQKKMHSDDLGYAVSVSASTGSRHLIIHLRNPWNPKICPRFSQMSAERNSPFISELTGENRMSCHIHRMKGIESYNSFQTSKVSGTNKVSLLERAHLFCLEIWIGLIIAVSLWLRFTCLAMLRKYSGYRRDRRHVFNSSLLKLPMNNLCTNAREGRTVSSVSLEFLPDREYLLNNTLWSPSPDPLWCSALIPETVNPLLLISSDPFGKPVVTPPNQLNDLIKSDPFIIKLYRLAAFLILILILHRLLLPNSFRKKYRRLHEFSYRCYDIFLVIDVMI
jgi:hypothetical protein